MHNAHHEVKPETLEYVFTKFEKKGFARHARDMAPLMEDRLDMQRGQIVQGLQTGNFDAMYRAYMRNGGQNDIEHFRNDLCIVSQCIVACHTCNATIVFTAKVRALPLGVIQMCVLACDPHMYSVCNNDELLQTRTKWDAYRFIAFHARDVRNDA